MFFKIKGVSAKSGKGTVSVVYRTKQFESLKSTGVTVLPTDFNPKTGRVSKTLPDYQKLNQAIQDVVLCFELAAQNVLESGRMLTKENLEAQYALVNLKLLFSKEITKELENNNIEKQEEIEQLEELLVNKKDELARKLEILNPDNIVTKVMRNGLEEEVTIFATPAKKGNKLTDKIAEFLKMNPDNYSKNTILGYQDLKILLQGYRSNLVVEDIDLKVFYDFQNYLITAKQMRNQSIRVTFARLKKVLSYYAEEMNLELAFVSKFKMVKELYNDNVVFLTDEELTRLEQLEVKSVAQNQVKQQFLFSCYTALRHSDLYISSANIKANELLVTMKKSKRTVKPPLTPKAKAILASEYFPFKKITINQYNKTVRALAKKAGIDEVITQTHFIGNNPQTIEKPKWELMSSHVARKTAINTWLNKGVRETVVALWAGHKNTKMIEKHYQNKNAASVMEFQKLL